MISARRGAVVFAGSVWWHRSPPVFPSHGCPQWFLHSSFGRIQPMSCHMIWWHTYIISSDAASLDSDVMAIYIFFLTYVPTNRFSSSSSGRIETFYFLLNQIRELRSAFCKELVVGIMLRVNGCCGKYWHSLWRHGLRAFTVMSCGCDERPAAETALRFWLVFLTI